MKKNMVFRVWGLVFAVTLLSSCASDSRVCQQAKQYERAQQVYHGIIGQYTNELELYMNQQMGVDQVRRCVLKHADQVRKELGFGACLTGRLGRYTSYPFLEYTRDLDDVVLQLNKVLRRLALYDADCCISLCQQIRELRQYLQEFRIYVISSDRYLIEQDKWDKAALEHSKQATLNALLTQSMQPPHK
jgi:hypothetical protein